MGCFPNRKAEPSLQDRVIDENNIDNKIVKVDGTTDHIKIRPENFVHSTDLKFEDNYKIICELGKGSFGTVYKVLHKKTGMIRALKMIKREVVKSQDDDKKFLKEIEILTKVSHPNIIRLYEYYEDKSNFYLINEFLAGGELYDVISSWTSFSEAKAAYILKQILSAVCYMHGSKIVHRDLKPENILVEDKKLSNEDLENFNIKLIDFGTCNYFETKKALSLQVGTPYYIAPEVLKGKYDEKCDLWSIGVIFYILLVGYPPFMGSSSTEILKEVVSGKFDIESEEWKSISDSAKDLISKMLTYDPVTRISAEEALSHDFIKINISQADIKTNTRAVKNVLNNIKNFNAKEKLQQATIAYIVHSLHSNKEIEDLKNIFSQLDKNGDGRLTYNELTEGFQELFGKLISEIELARIISEVDQDKDGYIGYEEFLRVSMNKKTVISQQNLKMAFEQFDKNRDGKLSIEEIKGVLGTNDIEYIKKLLGQVDVNKDGQISFLEFTGMMKGLIQSTMINMESTLKNTMLKVNEKIQK